MHPKHAAFSGVLFINLPQCTSKRDKLPPFKSEPFNSPTAVFLDKSALYR